MTMEEKRRLQFDFSQESLARIDDLAAKTGASTRAEVLRRALRFYEWLVTDAGPSATLLALGENEEIIARIPTYLLIR